MCSAGLKVMNFQLRTEPIRLFIFRFYSQIVKDELAVLQRRTAAELPAATRITFTLCYKLYFYMLSDNFNFPPNPSLIIRIKVDNRISLALFSILDI